MSAKPVELTDWDKTSNIIRWPDAKPYVVWDDPGATADPVGFLTKEVSPATWKDALIIAREWWVSQPVWKRSLLFGGTCSAVILTLAWFAWRAA